MCIRVGAKDLSSNSKQVSQPWEPISRLHFPAINFNWLSGKLRKVQAPFNEFHHFKTLKNLWGLLGQRELYGL